VPSFIEIPPLSIQRHRVTRNRTTNGRTTVIHNINLYSPTSGSKERNIQTYKYGEKATKGKTIENNSEQV